MWSTNGVQSFLSDRLRCSAATKANRFYNWHINCKFQICH